MAEDYWNKPYPQKGVIREVTVEAAPPPIPDISKLRPLSEMPRKAPKTEPAPPPKVQAPFLDSWPEAPPGTHYTLLSSEDRPVIWPGTENRVCILPQVEFKGMFLWCKPMRDVSLVDYRHGHYSEMYGMGNIPTSVFRRFVPWEAGTTSIGNIISFVFRNHHRNREYTAEVTILGLVPSRKQWP